MKSFRDEMGRAKGEWEVIRLSKRVDAIVFRNRTK